MADELSITLSQSMKYFLARKLCQKIGGHLLALVFGRLRECTGEEPSMEQELGGAEGSR